MKSTNADTAHALPGGIADDETVLRDWLSDNAVEYVECLVSDFTGTMLGKRVPVELFAPLCREPTLKLSEAIYGQTVAGQFVFGEVVRNSEPDLLLRPELGTLRLAAGTSRPAARVICRELHAGGEPVAYAPREILRRVLQLYADAGLRPVVAPELEFYLLDDSASGAAISAADAAHSPVRRAFGLDRMARFEEFFQELLARCARQAIDTSIVNQEVGLSQFEVNLGHGDALALADQVMLFKHCLKTLARECGYRATFMAKPFGDDAGSSMHVHQSVVRAGSGTNIFADARGAHSAELYAYIGGLQKYLPAVMPLLAPYANSYTRLANSFAALNTTHWAPEDRLVGLRLPAADAANRRIENRIAGSDTNPYLVMSATLLCGYLGLQEGLSCSAPFDGANAAIAARRLPADLREALRRMQRSEAVVAVLGAQFVEAYSQLKLAELAHRQRSINPWDLRNLVDSV